MSIVFKTKTFISQIKQFIFLCICFVWSISLCKAQDNSFLSRKELIVKAIEQSYVIANTQAEINKTRIDRFKAYQAYLPNVSLNSTYTRLNDDIAMNLPSIKIPVPLPGLPPGFALEPSLPPIELQDKNIFKTDISASMLLFSGLKVPFLSKAAYHKELAEGYLLKKEEIDIIIEITDYYDRLALLDQSLIVLEDSKKRLDEETAFAEKAYKIGLISAYDLSKIEIVKQELKAKQIDIESKRKMIISKLNQMTNISKEELENIHPSLEIWNIDITNTQVESRTELKSLKEAINATDYSKKADLASYMPNVFAFSKKELYTKDLSALDPEWYIGVGLRWNILDGGQNYRNMQKTKLDLAIAQNNYDNTLSLLKLNMEKSQFELEEMNQLINVAYEKKNIAKKGLEISIKQYELGLSSITERLAAETDFQNACLEYLQSIYQQRLACTKFLEANGTLNIDVIK